MIKSGKLVDGIYPFNTDPELTLKIQGGAVWVMCDEYFPTYIYAGKVITLCYDYIYIIDLQYGTVITIDYVTDQGYIINPNAAWTAFGVKTLEPVIVAPRKSTKDTVIYNLSGNIIKIGEFLPYVLIDHNNDVIVNTDGDVYRVDNFKLVYLFSAVKIYIQRSKTDYLYCSANSDRRRALIMRIHPYPIIVFDNVLPDFIMDFDKSVITTRTFGVPGHASLNYTYSIKNNTVNLEHIIKDIGNIEILDRIHFNPLNPPLPIKSGVYIDVTFILS